MKKKILSLMVSMALVMSCAACSKDDDKKDETKKETQTTEEKLTPADTEAPDETEEEYETPDPRGEKFEGTWYCDRCMIDIAGEDGGYKVYISWSGSAFEAAEWMYSCMYDESIDGLTGFGTKTIATYSDEGDATYEEIYDENNPIDATFVLDVDGHLVWNDEKENIADGMHFEKAAYPEIIDDEGGAETPSAESLASNYFAVIAAPHEGEAGYSLKLAGAAAAAYEFALNNDLKNADAEQLSANLLEAWEGLSDEEKASFDSNIIAVAEMISAVEEDWDNNCDAFLDAGADTQMISCLTSENDAAACWDRLIGATMTMGNSDGE